jgi:hypothetical protein
MEAAVHRRSKEKQEGAPATRGAMPQGFFLTGTSLTTFCLRTLGEL